MKSLILFYDEQCAFCRAVKTWLDGQPKYVPIRAVPYTAPEARYRFPTIDNHTPAKEILALADDGALYVGGDAWIICLWATRNYRAWSRRLSTPTLRPMAKRIAAVVAAHRYELSRAIFGKEDKVIANDVLRLHQQAAARLAQAKVPAPACACELEDSGN
jgi:predicted DCC family thiol-disulfide oxidoreductase YuxK